MGAISAAGFISLTSTQILAEFPLFSTRYLPHRFCYLAQPGLIWANVAADASIAIAYAIIFSSLFWIAFRLRHVAGIRQQLWIFLAFGLFIVACGFTHAMEIVTIWWPAYPLAAALKVVCAVASVPTAIFFAREAPGMVRRVPLWMDALSASRHERDEARLALLASERVLVERERAEDQIKHIDEQLIHILDSTSQGIMKIRRDWKLVYSNRQASALFQKAGPGSDLWECFPSLETSSSNTLLHHAMEDRVPVELELFYEANESWYRLNTFPTPDGFSIFFTSLSVQKWLETQLVNERAAALQQLESVMDCTSEGILKLGEDLTIVYGNRVAREILPDLIIGKNYFECFPAIRGSESEGHIMRALNDGQAAAWENFYEPYQEYYSVHVYPSDGGVGIFFVPITARKKLEQQLEEERMLREKRIEALSVMAGGLAHEISNPLAIIQGTASDLQRMVLSGKPLLPDEVLRSSENIINTSDRASRILRGLRGFAREAGSDPMEYASIYEIIDQAVHMQETRFDRHGVELKIQFAPNLPLMLCREIQVGQIITNLVNNAFDAITQQECSERWVHVEASQRDDRIQVDVVDSGPGIDAEAAKRLMEPFFTTKTRGLGMGVGLSLSRAIANEHGGSLELCGGSSETRFRLLLPVALKTGDANSRQEKTAA